MGQKYEGPLETKQKLVRNFKDKFSRKSDMKVCLTNTMNRLHLDASPVLRKFRQETTKKDWTANQDPLSDDQMVLSFLIQE